MIVTAEILAKDIENGRGKPNWFTGRQIADTCFFCGKKLTIPCFMWHGTNPVWMHLECAKRFCNNALFEIQHQQEKTL